MLENLAGDASNVFHGDGDAVVHQGAGFGSQDEVLRGTRAGAPVDPFVDETGRTTVLVGASALHQIHCVIGDVVRNRDAGDQSL